jgi:uncharacterized membrane protein
MPKMKKARFATTLFAFLILTFGYATYGILSSDWDITKFWAVGIGISFAFVYVFVMMGRVFGYGRSFLAMTGILAVVGLALFLNGMRSWPFGMVYHHDILGWKILKTAWPIPFFWAALIGGIVTIKKPSEISVDPKVLFSWAFDVALITMILAIVIEPLAFITRATTWVVPGAILGVPLSAFLGWFITSFIATFVAILILRPWTKKIGSIHHLLPLSYAAFFALTFILATKVNVALIQLLSAIYVIFFLLWTLRAGKHQNPLLTVEADKK